MAAAGRQLREDFSEIQRCNPHAGERGSEAEEILKQFLKERLPRRFDCGAGVVLGADGTVSRQSDVLIYDALNSPVYRAGARLQILPRDNVAAVIEVKSKLNKAELTDAAEKIAAIKTMKATPICGADQPVTFSELITTGVLGCVFAFDSYTSLETLAENLQEINESRDHAHWIDLVAILDKGCIGYALQALLQEDFIGWLAGPPGDDFLIPPFYVHLVQAPLNERTLHSFFIRLMSHLMFFRKISAIDLSALSPFSVQTLQGYQYNLGRQLVRAEKSHQTGSFQLPKTRFNLYSASDKKYVGQVCFLPWQDGAVLTFSTLCDPSPLFAVFLKQLKARGQLLSSKVSNATLWISTVLLMTEQQFITIAENVHPAFISVRDSDRTDGIPPLSL
ncbi:MAG: hypothetical protein QOE26_1882 [Verrucomicrobiota bacterium]